MRRSLFIPPGSSRNVFMGVTQPLTEMSTRNLAGTRTDSLVTSASTLPLYALLLLLSFLWSSVSNTFTLFRKISGSRSGGYSDPSKWRISICSYVFHKFSTYLLFHLKSPPLWSSGQSSWLQNRRPRVRFPGTTRFSDKKKKKKGNK
jgi:hypothetical protein